ncbi:glycosyltransferase family protein [Flindersiella endophytica]
MQVALVSVHVGTHTKALAKALATAHDVTIYTRNEGSRYPARENISDQLELVRLPVGPGRQLAEPDLLKLVPDFGAALAEAWAVRPPDVAHSQSWLAGLAALVGRENRAIPLVHTCHGLVASWLRHTRSGDDHASGPIESAVDPAVAERIRLESAIAHDVDQLIVTNRAEVEELRTMGVRSSKVTVIPNGVDLEHFRLSGEPTSGSGGGPRLLMLDGIGAHHGVETMVTALRGIPDAELVVAGGPARSRLKQDDSAKRVRTLADQCGVSKRVQLLGAVAYEGLPALISSADAVVSVSSYEPVGAAALQAMASGRAVIASAVGALSDVVIAGTTGVVVPPGKPRALAEGTRQLLRDPLRLEGYGLAGRERAEFRHSWSRIATETAQVYERVYEQSCADRLIDII